MQAHIKRAYKESPYITGDKKKGAMSSMFDPLTISLVSVGVILGAFVLIPLGFYPTVAIVLMGIIVGGGVIHDAKMNPKFNKNIVRENIVVRDWERKVYYMPAKKEFLLRECSKDTYENLFTRAHIGFNTSPNGRCFDSWEDLSSTLVALVNGYKKYLKPYEGEKSFFTHKTKRFFHEKQAIYGVLSNADILRNMHYHPTMQYYYDRITGIMPEVRPLMACGYTMSTPRDFYIKETTITKILDPCLYCLYGSFRY